MRTSQGPNGRRRFALSAIRMNSVAARTPRAWVVPAQQRFETSNFTAVEIEPGLVVQEYIAVLDSAAYRQLPVKPGPPALSTQRSPYCARKSGMRPGSPAIDPEGATSQRLGALTELARSQWHGVQGGCVWAPYGWAVPGGDQDTVVVRAEMGPCQCW